MGQRAEVGSQKTATKAGKDPGVPSGVASDSQAGKDAGVRSDALPK